MLDGVKDARADSARRVLFAAAGGLEWLYRATKNNPYKRYIDDQARQRADQGAQQREQDLAEQLVEQQAGKQPELGVAKQIADQKGTQEDARELARQLAEQQEIQPGKKVDSQQDDRETAQHD